ncbi:MAG: gentisate 1,2-dioxygenase, partial [Chloroflexota bacterium]|nr:gentisate 1,2-dioxygenase [Chloroflexota bacterium]
MIQEHPHGHVEDSPELQAFYEDLETMSTGALWTALASMMPDQPTPKAVPFLWQWKRLRPQL